MSRQIRRDQERASQLEKRAGGAAVSFERAQFSVVLGPNMVDYFTEDGTFRTGGMGGESEWVVTGPARKRLRSSFCVAVEIKSSSFS